MKNTKLLQYWFYSLLIMCLLIVLIGGATRLTGSGLSITEWKPVHGVIPPFNQEQWQDEFAKYKQIAQYNFLNQGISLDEFKTLFWWEWTHRLLARMIGLVALIPFVCLLIYELLKDGFKNYGKRLLAHKEFKYFVLMPLLVGLQGVIGWWMVYSGLAGSKLTSVSQYRLATHMISASLIIMLIAYFAAGLKQFSFARAPKMLICLAGLVCFSIMLQIYFGALVAGLHAGLSYNSWPLMEGHFVPAGMFTIQPWWHNFFENIALVQFTHRCFAYFVFILVVLNLIVANIYCPHTSHAKRSSILLIMVCLQILFGIVTLLYRVPISLGLLHQFFALVLFVFSAMHWRASKA